MQYISDMLNALMYHFWNNDQNCVWKDLRLPLILSIATYRYWDKQTPIYVVDISDNECYWSDYPSYLNFKVIRTEYHLKTLCDSIDRNIYQRLNARMLSKPIDIYQFSLNIPETMVLCVDVDYFFLKPQNFITKGGLCVGRNTGFWKYNKASPLVASAFDMWIKCSTKVCVDHNHYCKVLNETHRKDMNDETVMNYLLKSESKFFEQPDIYDNVAFDVSRNYYGNSEMVRGIHMVGSVCGLQKKGLICLYLKELRDILEVMIGADRMCDIFGKLDMPCCSIRNINKLSCDFMTKHILYL